LVFGQTLQYDFINYDDPVYISKNPQVTAGITSHGVVWAFKHIVSGNWHPLTIISHMLDCVGKPKSHLVATAVGRDVDSVCSVFNGGMNRGDGVPRTRFASKYRALPLAVSRRSHIRGIRQLARSIRDVGSGGRGESVVATHRLSSLLS
jgi:hypothetical protein